jgi:protein-disulfide isomerase
MTMRRSLLVLCLLVPLACSRAPEEAPPPEPVAELPLQELIALEGKAGSTDPLADATEPAPAPLEGVEGTPGPSPAFGPANAPVRVYLLTDFQCPVCRRVVEPLKHLARRYPKDVRIVLKHNALAMHARAKPMALASIAAFRQGKFWAYHDRMFMNAGQNDDGSLLANANWLGLDEERFKKDLADPVADAQVTYESNLATRFELRSTPSAIVNGNAQMGWGSYNGLANVVEKELARAKKIAESGVPPEKVAWEATRQSGPKGEMFAAALFPAQR